MKKIVNKGTANVILENNFPIKLNILKKKTGKIHKIDKK